MIKHSDSIYKLSRVAIYSAFIFMIITASVVSGQSVNRDEDLLSPGNRLKFGDHLFCEKDYLRAIQEYQEYLKYFNSDTTRFKFAFALAEIGRSTEALDNYKGLFFSSSLSEYARLEFYKINFLSNDFKKFRKICEQDIYLPEKHKPEINRLNLFTYLLDNKPLPDSAKFISSFPAEQQGEVLSLYLKKKFPEFKNPTKAAILSALIPGAGKIYTGHLGDGITAFIATGLLSYIAYDNFTSSHKWRGALFAGLAALTYAGNIYGAAASAQLYNAGIQFNFDNEVKVYLNKKNYFIPSNDFLCK